MKAVSSESVEAWRKMAAEVAQTASQAEPLESAEAWKTTVMNTIVRSASATERTQAWTMTEIASVEAIASSFRQACRNRGRLCRLPRE